VGQATTHEISTNKFSNDVDVFDIAWEKLEPLINKTGARALKQFPDKGKYDTVFGCTGYASFPTDKLDLLADEAMLVSGSSAAVEFNRKKMIDLAYKNDKNDFYLVEPEKSRKIGIHSSIKMQIENRTFSFMNAGFPINFDGKLECVPPQLIQITHALLLAASLETTGKKPGFHTLNYKYDNWVYENGLKEIESYSESR
jgi:hypothetical protein